MMMMSTAEFCKTVEMSHILTAGSDSCPSTLVLSIFLIVTFHLCYAPWLHNNLYLLLTPSMPAGPNCYCSKGSVPYLSNHHF